MKRLLLVICLFTAFAVSAQTSDSTAVKSPIPKSWAPAPVEKPHKARFAWGAEFGSSIDLSAQDMTSIDMSASFGVNYRWIMLAGMGAGMNFMINNSCRSYPVFAVFRTDFSSFMKIVFVEARGGMSVNTLEYNTSQTKPYAGLYVGFNLARGKKFRSYLTAGYTYVGLSDVHHGDDIVKYTPLNLASLRLGITF